MDQNDDVSMDVPRAQNQAGPVLIDCHISSIDSAARVMTPQATPFTRLIG